MNRRATLLWLPLAIFIGLATSFVLGLRRPDDHTIVSQMVGAVAPDFALPAAVPTRPALASTDLTAGRAHLLNFFASWCVPCAAEAPMLDRLARQGVPIVGVAVRDRPEATAAFLARNGNPYARIGADRQGRAMIDFGASGVPESYVVAGDGTIRLQIIGPIGESHLPEILAAMRAR